MKYLFVTCEYTSYKCKGIIYNVVISESIVDFMLRNKEKLWETDNFSILNFNTISFGDYAKIKYLNPTINGYLKLNKNDMGE